MRDEIDYAYLLFPSLEWEIKLKAEDLLIKGIESQHFVKVNEFNCNSLFEYILIKVGKKRKMSVIISKATNKVESLRRDYKYDHIYNLELFNSSKLKRPNGIIVSHNVCIESLNGVEADKVVGGFRKLKD